MKFCANLGALRIDFSEETNFEITEQDLRTIGEVANSDLKRENLANFCAPRMHSNGNPGLPNFYTGLPGEGKRESQFS
jgi:hypothetical protein